MDRMAERDAMDLVLYHGREGFVHHMQKVCDFMLQQGGEHPVFRLWRGFALASQGRVTEAIRDYTTATGRREVQIAVFTAHIAALKSQRQIDQDTIDDIETKLMVEEKSATPGAWLQCAAIHWMLGDHIKARDTCQKALDGQQTDSYINPQSLLGWINLSSKRSAFVEKSITNFEKAIDSSQDGIPNHVDAHLGKIAFLDHKRNWSAAIQVVNELIASAPSNDLLNIVNIEKAKILIKKGQWGMAAETAQRLLNKEPTNIQALMIINLYLLVEECRYSVAANSVRELWKALEIGEPKTHTLYAMISRTIARMSGGSTQILHTTQMLMNKACDLQPKSAEYISEKAFQLSLAGEWSRALEAYRQALQVDDGNLGALHGIIRSQLMLGKLDEAEQQLEFLNQMQISERPAELCYLTAVMRWRKHRNQAASIESIDEAVAIHAKQCTSGSASYAFYEQFNPQLLLAIIREYLQHCPTEPLSPTDPPSTIASKTRKPLELLVKHVKGSLEGQLLLARIDFIENDLEKAQISINSCIRTDPTFAEAHLLAAQIAYHQENYNQAQQALEQSMTEFEVRDWPQYNLLKARVANAVGKHEDALKDLEHALALTKQMVQGKRYRPLNVQDHVSIYLELAEVQVKLKNYSVAEETITEALSIFRGTPEEGRVVIAQAMIVCKKDVEKGLSMLRSVTTESPYFLKAKAHMANIYLNVRNNKRAFAKCYEELVEAFPTVGSYLFLGEAYMSIQEPEKAIATFEKARAMDPNDAEMSSKIGMAFVTTHDYQKAIQYYKNAVKAEPKKLALRHDLANLYWKLGSYSDAEEELKTSLIRKEKDRSNSDDLHTSMDDVRTLLLLAKVYKSSGDLKKCSEALIQARVCQNTVIQKVRGEQPELEQQQRRLGANICVELGEHYRRQKMPEKAVVFHNEALKQDDTHSRSMLALAQMYSDKGDLDGCEHQANSLLKVDPANEEASMMLADIMFRRNNYEDATFHFQQLLEKKPGNYGALVQFIQLLKRAGRLYEAPPFFTAAEKHARRSEPGLHYAKGLYFRYTNNPREALRHFHKGRSPRDSRWSEKCTCQMIEIYLNPGSEAQWSTEGEGEEQTDMTENITWAQSLLKDVKNKEKKKILEAYVLVAKRKTNDLEKALAMFYDIMTSSESDQSQKPATEIINVPCIVGMATVLQMMKQTPKARNHLKRVAKAPYNQDEADEFERAWLLLADIHIAGGKYDLAQVCIFYLRFLHAKILHQLSHDSCTLIVGVPSVRGTSVTSSRSNAVKSERLIPSVTKYFCICNCCNKLFQAFHKSNCRIL
eukprot:TRINITY_DN6631_c0_g1_i3.p1 TRINITY_DN6631_c0_g1~~TRINITY_DN6631_c0_g1_i3.p1  ORF type:complete len:1319 (+),score=237.31 TRINITY_DN6631_c0_g1_i3:49-3957(+)